MREEILRFMWEWPEAKKQPFANNVFGGFVRSTIPEAIYRTGLVPRDQYLVAASVGAGNWATIPWICVFDRSITTSATKGVYIVYLLSEDSQRLYLTLNQGCTDISQSHSKRETIDILHQKADQIRSTVKNHGFIGRCDIDLGEKLPKLGEFYREGTIFYTQYQVSKIPDEETLHDDLADMISIYQEYVKKTPQTNQKHMSDEVNYEERKLSINPAGPIELDIIVNDYAECLTSEEKLRALLQEHYSLCKKEIDLILDVWQCGIAYEIANMSEVRSYDLWKFIELLKTKYSLPLEHALIAIKYWIEAYNVSTQDSLNGLISCYEFKTIKYSDGKIYRGEHQRGKEHGYGVMSFPDGRKYEGQWEHGNPHGKGRHTQSNGNYYEGDWENGSAHGQGYCLLENGSIYHGEWQNGRIQGFGHQTFSNGSTYTGEYIAGEFNGYGIMVYENGDKYEGEWRDGSRSGQGICYYEDGGFYRGEWLNDKKHGYGYLKLNDGITFIGYFEDGMFQHGRTYYKDDLDATIYIDTEQFVIKDKSISLSGKGYIHYSNGSTYYGDLKEFSPHGKGCYQDAEGWTIEGDFFDGHVNGYCMMIEKDGTLTAGKWKGENKESGGWHAAPHGEAYQKMTDGTVFFGEWEDGKRNGHGIYEDADGTVYVGFYVNGNRQGKGYLINPDGTIYDGWFSDDKKNGRGRLICLNGRIENGIWANDKMLALTNTAADLQKPALFSQTKKPEIGRPIAFDPNKIAQLRAESDRLRDTLISSTEENNPPDEKSQTQNGRKPAPNEPILFDLKKIDQLRAESDQLRDALIESVDEAVQKENDPAAHPQEAVPESDEPQETEPGWQLFFDRIKEAYDIDVLYALLLGTEEFQKYAKKRQTMPDLLLDEINSIAMDTIGDLIADQDGIVEEYAALVEQKITKE